MSSDAVEVRNQFAELQRKYQQYLPKVDPALIDDLLLRQMEDPEISPVYMLEVFTKPKLDAEKFRTFIIQKTGVNPAIYDDATHYVTNNKVNLEMLKEISDSDVVIEVAGEYTGRIGAYGASHGHGRSDRMRIQRMDSNSSDNLERRPAVAIPDADKGRTAQRKEKESGKYRIAIYTAAAIVGAIALAGFIISGGLLPNSNTNRPIPPGTEPGALHGFVSGPDGLPAIGATVLAAQQGTDFTASEVVSITGQYLLSIPPGNYVVYVAYPDGTSKVVSDYIVERGSSHELNFSY